MFGGGRAAAETLDLVVLGSREYRGLEVSVCLCMIDRVCVCMRASVCACVRACVCVCQQVYVQVRESKGVYKYCTCNSQRRVHTLSPHLSPEVSRGQLGWRVPKAPPPTLPSSCRTSPAPSWRRAHPAQPCSAPGRLTCTPHSSPGPPPVSPCAHHWCPGRNAGVGEQARGRVSEGPHTHTHNSPNKRS